MKYNEIESDKALVELLNQSHTIAFVAFQNIDFHKHESLLAHKTFEDCIFLGCKLPETLEHRLINSNLVFPHIDLPFNPYRSSLYTANTLMGEYRVGEPESYEETLDKRVYNHFIRNGKEATDIKETLARRLHDHSITDALYDFLHRYDEKKVVAIMGGHSLLRNDPNYREIAKISKQLTELGFLMVSGGGPGAMEATHVGAWFAGKEKHCLLSAIEVLSEAPVYTDKFWLDKAFRVIHDHPGHRFESLGIPTWLYGHEPPTPFATQIAKYFANSVREEGLLAIAKGGVVFAPGSAGTIQEVFQDATQNHYLSFGYASPMIFFNCAYWTKEYPVYPLLLGLKNSGKYKNLILSKHDQGREVVTELLKFQSE